MKSGLWITTAVLFSVSVWAQNSNVGTGRYDQQIQQEVTKLLQSKDKWRGVTASTDDGIATLQGTVKLFIDKLDVGKKVDKLDHVSGVRNHVEVEGNVPDQQLQQQLADKLRYDRIGYGIAFNALGLNVQNGVVTVQGDVRDYPARDSALSLIATTPGVKDVVDNINVLPVSPMDDDIRIRVARAIYGNPALTRYANDPQAPIRIVVENGHVTLYGVVDSQMDKQIAETQAKSVPNVFSVDNKLVIAGQNLVK
ncbi:MAG TPA: BON domain-containing protein [Terriglobales bacterium]|jgi:osmotically-inducible protein OsmY|nr:BON domain-containing protein [Terriglobales bacterium]